jgi:hypothetical protein
MSGRRTARDYAARLGRVAGKAGPEADAGQQPPGDEYQEPQPMPTVTDRPPPARPSRRRGKRVRITVDLDRDTHRGLRQLALDADADASEVVRLLIGRALRDPGAAESIQAELDEGS